MFVERLRKTTYNNDHDRVKDLFGAPENWFDNYDREKKGYLTTDQACEGILKTFKLPPFQRTALKRLLNKRWKFPMSKNEAI